MTRPSFDLSLFHSGGAALVGGHHYQKTETPKQGKITVNGNPTSTGVRDGNSVGMHESHTAHDRV